MKNADTKRAKLLQYAERIWNITEGSDDQRIDAAIAATRAFFEQMGVPTRLSDYGLDGSSIPALLEKLQAHGGTKLGEHQDITLEVSRPDLRSCPLSFFHLRLSFLGIYILNIFELHKGGKGENPQELT